MEKEPQDQQQLVGEEEEVEEELPVVDVPLKTSKEAVVRFQLVSDLHLEFPGCLDKLPHIPANAPILCLLGDIGYPNKANYRAYLLEQADRFEHVLVVAGNHEYYNQESVQHADRLIDEICAERDNLHYLNKRSVRVGDVLFLGCTLWPYIPPESISKVWTMCNDYRRIVAEGKAIEPSPSAVGDDGGMMSHMMSLVYKKIVPGLRPKSEDEAQKSEGEEAPVKHRLTPHETNLWHEQHVDWLVQEIERVKEANGVIAEPEEKVKVVVLTHHAPSKFRCISPEDAGIEEICYDDLEWMMEDPVVVWGFGHTHWSSDNIINSTRVVSNQCGYITMAPDGKGSNYFDPAMVVDIRGW
ncbi:Ser/Thr phosphatase family superfamily protein [Acanthamoeba castellanii str. Neff]|uniref:Ser/Thr phosphatase family superfamily protein n=1 Tax=Acanthamoeba castellanii (strain ATCC 30010 / Neff) TaxID=1257118 RepID=L8GQ03_ACACF|nr:Ser/Thr phosphatase family superfamily protein [Acanthamoeba castellanii str. Neff]ELR14992.1 Ser/Thr phosphatase family superfamily protein [Acanthamoeba castellanii str. Neff]